MPSHRKRKCRFERELKVDLKTREPVGKPNAATEGWERFRAISAGCLPEIIPCAAILVAGLNTLFSMFGLRHCASEVESSDLSQNRRSCDLRGCRPVGVVGCCHSLTCTPFSVAPSGLIVVCVDRTVG